MMRPVIEEGNGTASANSRRGLIATARVRATFPVVTIGVSSLIIAAVALSQDLLSGLVAVAVLVIGLWGSYVLGRDSTGPRPPVRQSYRHLATLHAHLYALTERVAIDRQALTGTPSRETERARLSLEMAEFVVGQTLGVVADAMEDWAELAPGEVQELRKELQKPGLPPSPQGGLEDEEADFVEREYEIDEEDGDQ